MEEKQRIDELKKYIATAEQSLEAAKQALFELTGEAIAKPKYNVPSKEAISGLSVTEGGKIIEGIFDGENMVGPEGKVYPVPANYASKSKLVEGDRLKLTVAEDGAFIFKQIGPIERKKLIGVLNMENNAYSVLADGKKFNVLYASVTYYKAKPGDKVTIVVPAVKESAWSALENIIHDVPVTNQNGNPSTLAQDEEEKFDDLLAKEPSKTQEAVKVPVVVEPETEMPGDGFMPANDKPEEVNKNPLGESVPTETPKNDTVAPQANDLEI